MRLPRKGILIRLCIYGPIIAFLSWRAYHRHEAEQADIAGPLEGTPTQKVVFPDGSEREYHVIDRMPTSASMQAAPATAAAREQAATDGAELAEASESSPSIPSP